MYLRIVAARLAVAVALANLGGCKEEPSKVTTIEQAEKALIGKAFRFVREWGDGQEYELVFAKSGSEVTCTTKVRPANLPDAPFKELKAGSVRLFPQKVALSDTYTFESVELASDCYLYQDHRRIPEVEKERAKKMFIDAWGYGQPGPCNMATSWNTYLNCIDGWGRFVRTNMHVSRSNELAVGQEDPTGQGKGAYSAKRVEAK